MKNKILTALNEIKLEGEEFVQIPYAPDYYVSSLGRIFTRFRMRILNPDAEKYSRIFIKTITGYKHFQVHRIVAEMFCPRWAGQTVVHHVNKNKYDNRACNLVWCTTAYHKYIHQNRTKQPRGS